MLFALGMPLRLFAAAAAAAGCQYLCASLQIPPGRRVSHKVALTELEKFALMVAAVAHDMDHPGGL